MGTGRFLAEAQTLAKLDHPHLLKVSDFLRANDTAYIVMEYVEGESLEALVSREARLDAEWAQEMMWELINALWHVHRENILHRDLKPDNIQIRPGGSPVLIDFGAAREDGPAQPQHDGDRCGRVFAARQYSEARRARAVDRHLTAR